MPHAAAELVRAGPGAACRVRDAHPVEHLDGTGPGGPSGDVRVDAVDLGDLVADGVVRVQGAQRVLEDHGGGPAAQSAQFGRRRRGDVRAADPDGAAEAGARTAVQSQQGGGHGGLAAAGLAHDAEGPAGLQGEGDPVHGPYVLPRPADGEVDDEVGDLHQ